MKQIWHDIGLPDNRFNVPLTLVPCNRDQNKCEIKIRKDNIIKHFAATSKNIGQMIDQFLKQYQLNNELQKKKLIAYGKDPKQLQRKILLNNLQTGIQLFNKGLNDIVLQISQNQNNQQQGQKYPELSISNKQQNESKKQQEQKYFQSSSLMKIVSKIKQLISIKLIYQQKNKPDKIVIIQIATQQRVMQLKLKAKNAFGISSVNNFLLQDPFTFILNDNNPIYMQNLQDNCQVYIRIIQSKTCFPAQTKVKYIVTNQYKQKIITYKCISQLKRGDFIISYNYENNIFQQDKIKFVQKLNTKTLIQINTQTGQNIKSALGDLYLTDQGWKKYSVIGNQTNNPQILKNKLSYKDSLMYLQTNINICKNQQTTKLLVKDLVNYKPQKKQIQKIQLFEYQQSIQVYHLSIQKNNTYIVNGFIVHNMQIKIHNPNTYQTIQLNASPSDLIQNIKTQVSQFFHIPIQSFNLMYIHKQLDNNKSLNDYKITKGDHLIIHFLNNDIEIPSVAPLQKWLIVKDRQQTYKFKYMSHRDKFVWKSISQFKNTPPRYCSLLHGSIFLKPSDKISKVQQNPDFQKLTEITCIVVQSTQKILFYQQILTNDYKDVIEKYKQTDKLEQLIKKFRNNQFNRIILDQIFRFNPTNQELLDPSQIQELRQIILGFMSIQRYKNSTNTYLIKTQTQLESTKNVFQYDLYKRQIYNGFHKRYKVGQCFYFKQFLQTKKKNYKQIIQSNPIKQTIFFLRSLSGVSLGKISENQDQQEVVFQPFTYFTVDYLLVDNKQNSTVEYVFLTEMQTLYSYSQPFLLWIDDLPNSLSNQTIYAWMKQHNPGVQIIKLISTKQAQGWMNEFAWLVNWQNIKFKIISDMTRYEINTENKIHFIQELRNQNYLQIKENVSAAIDLIEICSQNLGYTTLITIFCGNKENAIKRVNQRELQRGQDYHQIIANMQQLRQNINLFLN